MDTGIINFAVYENGSEYLGLANATLPDKVNKKQTVNGAGIAGDVDVPVVGNYDAMSLKLTFTDVNDHTYKICTAGRRIITLNAAHEQYNSTKGEIEIVPHKYVIEALKTGRTNGTVAPASMQGASVDFSVLSLKEYINGELVEDFDPINFKDIDASGTDNLAAVRSALGK